MHVKITRQLRAATRRIEQRLDKSRLGDYWQPVLAGCNIRYELAERARGLAYGGLGAIVVLGGSWGWPRRSTSDWDC